MDFREIQYVAAIQKHQTLSGAARFLDISQPSLSKFLQNLEARLSLRLFERIENKMILTYAGRQYMDIGLKILDLNHQLNENLNDISKELKGCLSIGITPTRGRYVLPNVLPCFIEAFPDYKINIVEGGIHSLNQALKSGAIDLSIYTVFDEYYTDFEYDHICREEIVLAVSPDNPLTASISRPAGRKHPWIDLELLKNERFLMVDKNLRTRKIANRIISASSVRPEIITLQSVETALSMAAAGIGVCFCTDMCERFFYTPKPLLYCSTGSEENIWDFVIAHRKDRYLSEACKFFIRTTEKCFQTKNLSGSIL